MATKKPYIVKPPMRPVGEPDLPPFPIEEMKKAMGLPPLDVEGVLPPMRPADQITEPTPVVTPPPAPTPRAAKAAQKIATPIIAPPVEKPVEDPAPIIKPEETPKFSAPITTPLETSNETRKSTFDWGALLAGATPVLAGYLAGDIAGGFQGGGQALLEVEKNRREAEILNAKSEAAKARALASARDNIQLKPMVGPDGNVIYGTPQQALGQRVGYASSDLENYAQKQAIKDKADIQKYYAKGQNFTIRADENGRIVKIDKTPGSTAPPQIIGDTSTMSKESRKDTMRVVENYNKSTAKDVTMYTDLTEAYSNLINGGQLAKKLALMGLVKSIEERMTNEDRDYYTKEISELQQIGKKVEEVRGNEINPRLIGDASAVIGRALDKIDNRVNYNRKKYQSQLKAVRPELSQEQIEAAFGSLPPFTKGVYMQKDDDVRFVPWKLIGEGIRLKYKAVKGE